MKNPITSKTFHRLKEDLNARSFYELARLLGKPQTSIQRYKDGNVSITLDNLAEMAERAGYEINLKFDKKQ